MAISEERAEAERELTALKRDLSLLHKDLVDRSGRYTSDSEDDGRTLIERHNLAVAATTWERARFVTEKLMAKHGVSVLVDQ